MWHFGTSMNFGNTFSPSNGTWYHLAITRSGTSVKFFVDGTQVGSTATNSTNINSGSASIAIGGSTGAGDSVDHNGNFAAVRITKGVARYTASFTPPSLPLPSSGTATDPYWANVAVLFRGASLTSSASGTKTVTAAGGASAGNSPSKWGAGSLKFTNSGDFISSTNPLGSNFFNTSTAWTVEGWYNIASATSNSNFFGTAAASNSSAPSATGIFTIHNRDGSGKFGIHYVSGGSYAIGSSLGTEVTGSTWSYIAQTYDGTNHRLYVDGVLVDSRAVSAADAKQYFFLGLTTLAGLTAASTFYAEDFRVTDGVARYTGASMSVPTTFHPTS